METGWLLTSRSNRQHIRLVSARSHKPADSSQVQQHERHLRDLAEKLLFKLEKTGDPVHPVTDHRRIAASSA